MKTTNRFPVWMVPVVIMFWAQSSVAVTRHWDGGAGTQLWVQAANWAPDGVPLATDDVVIDGAGSITVVLDSGTWSINSLNCSKELRIIAPASLSVAQASAINVLQLSGTLGGVGNISITGPMVWLPNGWMTGTGTTAFETTSSVTLPGSLHINRTVDFFCDVNWSGGILSMQSGRVRNHGIFSVTQQSEVRASGGPSFPSLFENYGIVHKSSFGNLEFSWGGGNSRLDFFNHGQLITQMGRISCDSGGGSGAYVSGTGTEIDFGAPQEFSSTSTFTGTGSFHFTGHFAHSFVCRGTVDVQGNCTLAAGPLNFEGPFTAAKVASDGCEVRFAGPTTWMRGGPHDLDAAEVTFDGKNPMSICGTLTNSSIAGDGDVSVVGTANIWTNSMSGSGRTLIDRDSTVSLSTGDNKTIGRVVVNDGELTVSGTIRLADGVIENHNLLRFNPSSQATQSIRRASGTTVINNYGLIQKSGVGLGTFGSGNESVALHNYGEVRIDTGELTLMGGGSNFGTIVDDSRLTIAGSFVHGVDSSIEGTGEMTFLSGSHVLANVNLAGTISLNGSGAPSVTMTRSCPNLFFVIHNSGTLTVMTPQVWRGLNVRDGSTLAGPGDIQVSQTLIAMGHLRGSGLLEVDAGALLQIASSFTLERQLLTHADGVWLGGTITVDRGAWTNKGVVTASSSACLLRGVNRGGKVINEGSFRLQSSGVSSFTSVSGPLQFNNRGQLDVEQGTLELRCNGEGDGTVNIDLGATVKLFDRIVTGSVNVNGALHIENNGVLRLIRNLSQGPVSLVKITRQPASPPGVLANGDIDLAGTLQATMTPVPSQAVVQDLMVSRYGQVTGQPALFFGTPSTGRLRLSSDRVMWLLPDPTSATIGNHSTSLLLAVASSWGTCPSDPCVADTSPDGGDGRVDGDDLRNAIDQLLGQRNSVSRQP